MNKQNFELTTKQGEWYSLHDLEHFRLIELLVMEQELPHPLSSNLISVSTNSGLIAIVDNNILPHEYRHPNIISKSKNNCQLKIYSSVGVECTYCEFYKINISNTIHYISWNNSSDHLFVFSDNTTISIYDYRCHEVQDAFRINGPTYAHTPTRNGILFLWKKSNTYYTLCLLHFSNAYHTYKFNELAISEFISTGHSAITLAAKSGMIIANTKEEKSTKAEEAIITPSRCKILALSNNDSSSTTSDTMKCLVLLRYKTGIKEELQQQQKQQEQHMLQCVFHPSRNEMKELKINLESLSIVKWSLSPDEKYYILLTEEGVLYMTSSSFDTLRQISSNVLDTDTILQLEWLSNSSLCYLQQQADFVDDALVHTCELHFWHVNTLINESKKTFLSAGKTTFESGSRNDNNIHSMNDDDDDDDEKNDEEIIDGLSADTFCVREVDGLQLTSGKKQLFLQEVPECVRRVFSLGSQYSSAKLVIAFDKFMSGDPTAVTLINDLKSNKTELARAIDDCVETAKWEFDVEQEKRLLRVAALGKSLYELYDATNFIQAIQTIRLRHTLNTSTLRIIITDKQLNSLGADRLIRRLVLLSQFSYAITTSQVFGMEESDILHEWAVMQFTKSDNDDDYEHDSHKVNCRNDHKNANWQGNELYVAKKVTDKLTSYSHFSFTKLALTLHSNGKRHAARMILENEKIPSRQVSTLLSINEPEVALEKAVKSHQADLIFTAVQFLVQARKANAIDFIMSIPEAKSVLEQITLFSSTHKKLLHEYRQGKLSYAAVHENLSDYFEHEFELKQEAQHGHDAKNGEWWQLLQQSKIDALENLLAQLNAQSSNTHASNDTSTTTSTFASTMTTQRGAQNVQSKQMTNPQTDQLVSREHNLQVSNLPTSNAIDANMRWQAKEVISAVHLAESVVHEQNACMKECSDDDRFINASVSEMIQYAFEHRKVKLAERLGKKFNVPDAMFVWSMLRGYASTNDWEAIDNAILTRIQANDAFDTEPVITTLLLYNRTNQAKQYIPRVANINRRMEYYVTCEDWRRAAEDCKDQRDLELLCQLRERARGNTDALREINSGWDGALETTRIDLKRLFS